jgi:hypothetical protein
MSAWKGEILRDVASVISLGVREEKDEKIGDDLVSLELLTSPDV